MTREPDYSNLPIFTAFGCRTCQICGDNIQVGDNYHNGGGGRVAHVRCAKNAVQLADAQNTLATGGYIRYTCATGRRELVASSGVRLIDGRTYQELLTKGDLEKREKGSVETGDLIVEWRMPLGRANLSSTTS